MLDLLLTGRLVLPGGVLQDGWLGVAGGRIACLGDGRAAAPEARLRADYPGAYLMPGAIDGQTHAGSQHGFEGIGPTTAAAARGGVTTIVDMPYDAPDPIADAELLARKIEAVGRLAHTHVALYGTVAPEPDPAAIRALVEGGVCAFKISSFEAHPHRFPRIGSGAMSVLFEALAGTGLPVGLHNEDEDLIRATEARMRAAGRTAPADHSPSRPPAAELAATASFLQLAAGLGGHAHIVHISLAEGFDLVAAARARGARATAEMCLHYLVFDAGEDIPRLGARMKVNPPIREGQREALWDVLNEGGAAFVSSDHSAWSLERKSAANIFDVSAGMPGLEVLLPGFFTEALRRRGSADAAASLCARMLAEGPAAFFGLAGKGRLAPGADADIAVLAVEDTVYDAAADPDGPGWSAYHGMTFAARPRATYVAGTLAFDGASVTEHRAGLFEPRRV
jgi:allantoinase